MTDIVKALRVMCNQNDPQDRKLLLLAELVATKCESLSQNQEMLKNSLDKTNEKLDKVAELLEKIESEERTCPVQANRNNFERISFMISHPRAIVLIIIGALSLSAGVLGTGLFNALKFVVGL